MAWRVDAVELPFGDTERTWWVAGDGAIHDEPIDGAEPLPGRFALAGLVDGHAHPAVTNGTDGPTVGDPRRALLAWAESGVTLVRDVGSPGGVTLDVAPARGLPRVHAAGRFLAPKGRYFPDLLVEPVDAAELVAVACAQIERGATWVKIIGDFPRVPELTDVAQTYPIELVTKVCEAVHARGARVAVHTTMPDAGRFVAAGVDSIEHGPGLDVATITAMAGRRVAWTPTLCAMLQPLDDPDARPDLKARTEELRERLRELLPLAVALGVPVLAGTDVVGTIPREVAHLSQLGLDPQQALAAASLWAREFVVGDIDDRRADVVTYDDDPRDDPDVLRRPAAVVIDGTRVR